MLRLLERHSAQGLMSSFDQASLHVALSDNERALAGGRLYPAGLLAGRTEGLAWFDPLSSDPPFQDLMRRMRFPD